MLYQFLTCPILIAVYNARDTPVVILNELLRLYPLSGQPPLSVKAQYDNFKKLYSATVRIESLSTVSGVGLTAVDAKRTAQLNAFHFLNDLTRFVYKFKRTDTNTRNPLHLLEECLRYHPNIIMISCKKERQYHYRANVTVTAFRSFEGYGTTQMDAKEAVARATIDHFKDFAIHL